MVSAHINSQQDGMCEDIMKEVEKRVRTRGRAPFLPAAAPVNVLTSAARLCATPDGRADARSQLQR